MYENKKVRVKAHYDKRRSRVDFTVSATNMGDLANWSSKAAETYIFNRLRQVGFAIEPTESDGFLSRRASNNGLPATSDGSNMFMNLPGSVHVFTGSVEMLFSVGVRKFRGATSGLSLLSADPKPNTETASSSKPTTWEFDPARVQGMGFAGLATADENKGFNLELKPAALATPAPAPASAMPVTTSENGKG